MKQLLFVLLSAVLLGCSPTREAQLQKVFGKTNASKVVIEEFVNKSTLADRILGWKLKHSFEDARDLQSHGGFRICDPSDTGFASSEVTSIFGVSNNWSIAYRSRTGDSRLYWVFSDTMEQSYLMMYR